MQNICMHMYMHMNVITELVNSWASELLNHTSVNIEVIKRFFFLKIRKTKPKQNFSQSKALRVVGKRREKIEQNKMKPLRVSNKHNWHLQTVKHQCFYLIWPMIILVNAFLYMWWVFFLSCSQFYIFRVSKRKKKEKGIKLYIILCLPVGN